MPLSYSRFVLVLTHSVSVLVCPFVFVCSHSFSFLLPTINLVFNNCPELNVSAGMAINPSERQVAPVPAKLGDGEPTDRRRQRALVVCAHLVGGGCRERAEWIATHALLGDTPPLGWGARNNAAPPGNSKAMG
jgi:hypothetical protein